MKFESLIGPCYESQSPMADCERLVNFYAERLESQGATARWALYPTPGVMLLSAATSGPGRAHFFMDGREFAIIATSFIEINAAGVQTIRGTVALDANPGTINSNGDGGGQLFVTSGSNGYNYDLATNTLTQIAALNGKATQGGHVDGYFLALDADSSTFYISNLLDGTTWDTGTDFAQRTTQPDPWIAMRVFDRYIRLFGELTSEVWYNTGAASFPFAPHQAGGLPNGIVAAFSAEIAGRDSVWLGTSRVGGMQVLRAAGFSAERVSTYALEQAIEKYAVVSDAIADTYQENGHTFYILSFPTEDVTWCWDAETRQWHERGEWIDAEQGYTALRPRWHAYAFGQHRMLDSENGSVYHQSTEIATDVDGQGIRRMRRAPALVNELERVFFSSLELDVETGLGLTTGQGSDPQMMLKYSNDGGKTWSSERSCSAGKIGDYLTRVRWNRCGSARRRVFEVAVSDPIPWRLVGAFLELGQPIADQQQGQPQQRSA